MGRDKDDKDDGSKHGNDRDKHRDDGGKHGKEDYTRNGRPDPLRPVPQPPDPNKHDR
ncbi:MAG: hypothetical protein ACRDTE_07075 [Pseudonocardiaceae bacterium]